MTALNRPSKNAATFFLQAAIAFGVSFLGTLGGILFLPLDLWQRLFVGMTVLFLVTSSFTPAKVIRVRLDEGRMETFWQNAIRSPRRADMQT